MIRIENITKYYDEKKKSQVKVFENLSFEIQPGDLVAITGKSGSGKSTLINILAGLDCQTSGDYYFDSKLVIQTSKRLAEFRRNNIGILVQNFALINEWTIFNNMALPLKYKGYKRSTIKQCVHDCAMKLGIVDNLFKYPSMMSGGENQRAAIGRAIIGKPKVILADEPTASLDEENEDNIFSILKDLRTEGITIIIATHDKRIYENCDYQIKLS